MIENDFANITYSWILSFICWYQTFSTVFFAYCKIFIQFPRCSWRDKTVKSVLLLLSVLRRQAELLLSVLLHIAGLLLDGCVDGHGHLNWTLMRWRHKIFPHWNVSFWNQIWDLGFQSGSIFFLFFLFFWSSGSWGLYIVNFLWYPLIAGQD